jgi:hypothetical protein
VSAQGYERVADDEIARRFDAIIERRRGTNGNAEGTLR